MFATNRSVAALTQGRYVPSTRFRWGQYVGCLEESGLTVREFCSFFGAYAPSIKPVRPLWIAAALAEGLFRIVRSSNCRVVFLQRNLIATLCSLEPLIKQPIVFDVDDAIFIGPRGASADRIARRASVTLCGNSYLADHFSQFGSIEIVPTAVDTDRFIPVTRKSGSRPIIGWSGTSSGFKYLEAIQPALKIILQRYPDVLFKVVSDKPPILKDLPVSQVVFEKWHPEIEVKTIQGFTVGIMPLEDTLWERGKCSYKMLTYMAVGVPVVVSPVGMNVEVLALGDCGYGAKTHADWVDAVSSLLLNSSMSGEMGRTGRMIIKNNFSLHMIGPRLAQIIQAFV